MTIDKELLELFSERVTLYEPESTDKYGKCTWSASGVSACAHLTAETKLTKAPDGRDIVETGTITLYGQVEADTDYRVVLEDGSEPIIIGVDKPYDEDGWHHTVIRIGQ